MAMSLGLLMFGRMGIGAGSERKISRMKLLMGSSLLALLIGGISSPGQAFAQQTSGRMHEFHISSQPLDRALNQLAEQAGVQLAYKTANIGTRGAPALNGSMTTEQALSRLLSGTGLQYKFSAANAVTISGAQETAGDDASAGGATVLKPIEINGTNATTEGTNSYRASAVTVAGKI
ncbi:MAG: STN domain-containing protein, partial [Rhizobiaceae bacterium]|nr:STN domain-containing protein [Rhizobiaceae bacterium]